MSGSNKRINQLQALFDEPPRYGKDLDWTGYSVHDAASVLRRYLNQMPVSVHPSRTLTYRADLSSNASRSPSFPPTSTSTSPLFFVCPFSPWYQRLR